MAAERRSSARCDGAHDTALGAAEMLGMHLAVGFAVAAEDLRHLPPGRHDGSSGRLSHLQLEPVERALRAADRGGRDPGVTRRGRQVVVAEQHLDGTDVGAGFEQMSGEAVPQRVHRAVEQKRELLCALQGVGGASAAILAREVFARQFASRRQLGSYLGLTPSAYDSGSTTRRQGISKAGNSWARRVLIEVAWLWRKYQPGSPLSHWYTRKTADQSPRIRRIMLIALARKLAISLWRYVETGLVPDGAVMAKTTPHMAAAA